MLCCNRYMAKQKFPLALLSESAAATRGIIKLTTSETVLVRGGGGPDYVCGRCGATLGADGPDLKRMQNAAGRCNACGAANDLTRVATYRRPPTLASEIDDSGVPAAAPPAPPPMTGDAQFDMLAAKLAKEWSDAQGALPSRLYHYTTAAGLQGILRTHRVWASDMVYLNDSSEMKFGLEVIEKEAVSLSERVSAESRRMLELARTRILPVSEADGFCVVCFCSKGDVLSQWRAYGSSGGGFALCFSGAKLASDRSVSLRRVVYDVEQQTALVRSTLEQICAALDSATAGMTPEQGVRVRLAYSALLGYWLREFATAFKHPAFAEENEWRVVVPFNRATDMDSLRFRSSGPHLVPYVEYGGRLVSQELPLLPIVEVMHGPVLHGELAKKSLHLLLQSTGYDHVEVVGSGAPLRG